MNKSADTDPNFVRAMRMLDRMENPEFLFTFWRAAGDLPDFGAPTIEQTKPWWNGLESLIKL